MDYEIRELTHPDELNELIELQAVVGGLPPRDTMSPITLSALTLDRPRVGWVLGAYADGKMICFIIGFPTAEPGLVLGHMLGVLPEYRNSGVGLQALRRVQELYRRDGFNRVCWTYEPLESPNAHLYISNLGAMCVHYKREHYFINEGLHAGMPQDRMLIELDMENPQPAGEHPPSLETVLQEYPSASVENMPDVPDVLVEIPGNLRRLQKEDAEAALAWRLTTRTIFEEYINNRGYVGYRFFTGVMDGQRRSFYLLGKV
jgi:predicted GNAT superfamily acetyltransferase